MDTLQHSTNKPTNGTKTDLSGRERVMIEDVRNFFLTDSCAEIIGSMNGLVEAFLFSEDLQQVCPARRVDIVNQLRAVTLLAKLNEST